MRKFAILVLALLPTFLVCSTSNAFGSTLFSFTAGEGGSQPGTVTSMTYPIGYPTQWPETLFARQSFTLADIGQTVTITPATDPNFKAFTSMLTDGTNEIMTFWFDPAPAVNESGQDWYESYVVWGSNTDPRVDLHGYDITA